MTGPPPAHVSFDVSAAARVLGAGLPPTPDIAVVLGSGMGALETALDDPVAVPFSEVPGLPGPGVVGHGGRFVHGRLRGVPVILQAGRIHGYEGHGLDLTVAPVRILSALGVKTLLMTSAVGAVHPLIEAGDIVLVDDQINLTFRSPLAGPVADGEERFPDMSAPFDRELGRVLRRVAVREGIALRGATYAGVTGPAYETAAEVEMIARLGGDVVGMSTVPEVITAAARGMRCAVLALVTNKATGRAAEKLSHEDVLAVGRDSAERMVRLVASVVADLGQSIEAK